MNPADRLLFSPEEVATLLHIGRTRVYRLISEGRLESVRIGRSRRVPRTAIAAFLEQLST